MVCESATWMCVQTEIEIFLSAKAHVVFYSDPGPAQARVLFLNDPGPARAREVFQNDPGPVQTRVLF